MACPSVLRSFPLAASILLLPALAAGGGAVSPALVIPGSTAAFTVPAPRTADGRGLVYPYAPYNEGKMDPQLTGWPLTDAEREWIAQKESTRRPGREAGKTLPGMWFVTPAAGQWVPKHVNPGTTWLDFHAASIRRASAAGGRVDVALVGDSITEAWGGGWDGSRFNGAWQKHFPGLKTINLGISGDRTEHLLWRLDHGALDGLSPKVIVLMIGVNNAPLVHDAGIPAMAAAQGIRLCVENLRLRCPEARIVLCRILPAFNPARAVGKAIADINAALDSLKLDRDPYVRILDAWNDFLDSGGSLRTELYGDRRLHPGRAGYDVLAARLQPLIQECLRAKSD